ncbi:MAG: UpxY family transcription antiterminator [Gemmatimonadota bacterium]|nr:UpxY family transcription antiterminator [Gemmatimonadota bacterium]
MNMSTERQFADKADLLIQNASETGLLRPAPPAIRWYACRTKSRAEKRVAERLVLEGIESYLPLVLVERQWSDRKTRVPFPLFSGYVFARFELTQVHEILKTPGVSTIIRTGNKPSPVRDQEIESVRIMVEAANQVGVLPTPADDLVLGDDVIVVDGPFKGVVGTLIQARKKTKVLVRLTTIRQGVSVEIDRRHLKPAI